MTAIAATTGTSRTRVDGTFVLTIEYEPRHAGAAYELFGKPGTQVATVALKDGTYLEQQLPHQPEPEKPKGGDLARIAGIWCNEPKFWRWIYIEYGVEVDNDMQAAEWIRKTCQVSSRAELDNNQDAGTTFHKHIREPYLEYLRTL